MRGQLVWATPLWLGRIGKFSRVIEEKAGRVGFDVKGDTGQYIAKNFHDTLGVRNISLSIDPDGLSCLACDHPHNLRENVEAGIPMTVIVSYQSFPPVLTASNCKCVVVVRADGRYHIIGSPTTAHHHQKTVGKLLALG